MSETPAKRPLPRFLGGKRIRLSQDSPVGGLAGSLATYSAPDPDTQWRSWDLDSHTLDRMAPADLIELLSDLSPDIARALWDFLRMSNPGWEAKAWRVGGKAKTEDPQAQSVVNAFMGSLDSLYGSADVVLNRLFTAAFVRGAFFAEIVLDQSGRIPLDLATPDPRWVRFRKRQDEQRGEVWEPFQWQNGKQVSLDVPTIRYVPVDPLPGSPWGRAPVAPALFTVLFALGLLHDLRRVVSQQGYPRLDIAIDLEKLRAAMPAEAQSDPEAFQEWLDTVVQAVYSTYETLEPDDAYVHPDYVTVNRPVGTVDSSSLSAIDGLFQQLETWAVRALKTMPLLFGASEGTSEANANRQWEIHVAGIKALQHLCERLLEHFLSLVLRAQGKQAEVEFRFSELRASEMLRDAQTEKVKIENATAKYQAGWISQDAAAVEGAGVERADKPEPRNNPSMTPDSSTDPKADTVEPGANRGQEPPANPLSSILHQRDTAPSDPLPEKVRFSDAEIDAALEEWDDKMGDFAGLLDAKVV